MIRCILLLALCLTSIPSLWSATALHVPYAPQTVLMARHIQSLEHENQQLVERVNHMENQLDAVLNVYQEYMDFSWWQLWPLNLIANDVELHYFLGLFLLIFIGLWVWVQNACRSVKSPENATSNAMEVDHEEDEYNYLASEDALPAKLDLARAYIAMEDTKSAFKVLTEVMQLGSPAQQLEAKRLYESIQSA